MLWNAREIYFIAIYEYDMDTGELDMSPVQWQSYDDTGQPLPSGQLLLTDKPKDTTSGTGGYSYSYETNTYTKPEKKVVSAYENAKWCEEFDVPSCFVTLKLKETENDSEHDRG
jgi:hypothetical protein